MKKQEYAKKVLVIGAGMAGSDAAWFLAEHGVSVVLAEAKRLTPNPSQHLSGYAELVCSNSLKSIKTSSAHGLLKREMQSLGSLIIREAYAHRVPAGDALAVDRERFSESVTRCLQSHPHITCVDDAIADPIEAQQRYGADYVLVASGPLTTPSLENWMKSVAGARDFYFYDAIAPVVDADSLDYTKLFFKDRYTDVDGDHEADYLNAPMTADEYERFVTELLAAKKVPPRDFEEWRFFEGCLPVDLMAERGRDTLRFSCMKPVGLTLPDGTHAFAVVQLRRENLLGSAYNVVGFQTRLTHSEQIRVFQMIPGLEKAEFLRTGSVHRNTFIHARTLLNSDLSFKAHPQIFLAGQVSGVEGYTESAASGLYAAYQIVRRLSRLPQREFPVETGIGALVHYLMTVESPCPSNIHFGLLPPVLLSREDRRGPSRKQRKKELASERAQGALIQFLNSDERLSEEGTR